MNQNNFDLDFPLFFHIFHILFSKVFFIWSVFETKQDILFLVELLGQILHMAAYYVSFCVTDKMRFLFCLFVQIELW